MNNQVLSIKQMQELQELGIDTSKASMCWFPKIVLNSTRKSFVKSHFLGINRIACDSYWNTREGKETIPTFTLQDILQLTISTQPTLWQKDGMPLWCIQDYMNNCYFSDTDLMMVAFKYAKWCLENNQISSNKNSQS